MIKIFHIKLTIAELYRVCRFLATDPDYHEDREYKAIEEMSELIKEITHQKMTGKPTDNFYKEGADVIITVFALMMKHNLKQFIYALRVKLVSIRLNHHYALRVKLVSIRLNHHTQGFYDALRGPSLAEKLGFKPEFKE